MNSLSRVLAASAAIGLLPYFTTLVAADEMPPLPSPPPPPALKIAREVKPVFPVRMLQEGIAHGEVIVAINVDEHGEITDLLPIRYTHKEFANVAIPALREWKFHPLVYKGETARAVAEVIFRFEVEGVLVVQRTISAFPERDLYSFDHYDYEPCSPADLDRHLTLRQVVKPVYTKDLSDKAITGEVQVEFYIDESGRTRFPVATFAEHDLLAMLAAAAVEQWRFDPPTRRGQPVIVRAQQKFSFIPETSAGATKVPVGK